MQSGITLSRETTPPVLKFTASLPLDLVIQLMGIRLGSQTSGVRLQKTPHTQQSPFSLQFVTNTTQLFPFASALIGGDGPQKCSPGVGTCPMHTAPPTPLLAARVHLVDISSQE